MRTSMAEGIAQLWGTKAAQAWSIIWAVVGQPLLFLIQAMHEKWSGLLTMTGADTACAPTHIEHLHQPHCCSTAHFWGKCAGTGSRENYTLRGNRASSNLTFRVSTPASWDLTLLYIGKWQSLSRGEAPAHTGSGPGPSNSSPTSYQGDSCQHSLRKDVTCVYVKYSSPTKATGHMQTVLGFSHIRTPLQDHNM